MRIKKCSKCYNNKLVSDFYKMKGGKFGVMGFCKVCLKEYQEANKEKRKAYREANKDKTEARNKAYYQSNKDKLKERHKAYNEANKEKYNVYQKSYNKERRKTDHLYALKYTLRSRTLIAFKLHGYKKDTKTAEMIGVSWDVLKKHIENQFDHRMNWDNRGKYGWHIDHVLPLSSAKTEEELIELCHYTNLQPMWWDENIEKGGKIIKGTQTKIRL